MGSERNRLRIAGLRVWTRLALSRDLRWDTRSFSLPPVLRCFFANGPAPTLLLAGIFWAGVAGCLLEFISMAIGLKNLVLVAMVSYLLAVPHSPPRNALWPSLDCQKTNSASLEKENELELASNETWMMRR